MARFKLCRLRIIPDQPLIDSHVRQTLFASEGRIEISGDGWRMNLWADTTGARLHVDYTGVPIRPGFVYDLWRYRDRPVTPEEMGQCRDLLIFGESVTRADRVDASDGRLVFRHVNEGPNVFDRLIRQQRLEDIAGLYNDVLTGRITGGIISIPDTVFTGREPAEFEGTDCMGYKLEGVRAQSIWTLTLTALSGQYRDEREWRAELESLENRPIDPAAARAWWAGRFADSYVEIDPDHPGSEWFAIGRNYMLFRYMQLCNATGVFPTKFNGGLFTFDEGHTPDYRNWGGTTFTAQNQRLVYWPMLKSSDFDAMLPQFEFYRRIADAQRALSLRAIGHEGAFFDEQITVFGMACAPEYERPGLGRRPEVPVWDQDCRWVRLHFSTALEFALMMLEYHRFSGRDITGYMPFIDSAARFYFAHYPTDEAGKLHIFPSTALETYKGRDPDAADANEYGAANPMDAVAGLRAVLRALIELGFDADGQYARWLDMCPDLPVGERRGYAMFLPAQRCDMSPTNCELPQLYRVFPFGRDGLTEDEKRLAINTYRHGVDTDEQRLLYGWHQNGIFAARLGLLEEAVAILKAKLSDSGRRFPAFWGPGHDWTPDHNHGGSGAIQLQEMLMNTDGGRVRLFPCWPREVDVCFRFHTPGGGVVEAEQRNGERVYRILP